MSDALLELMREQAKQIADLRRRMNTIVMHGTVKERKGKAVRLDLQSEDGTSEFVSPLVPVGRPSGKNGGGVSQFTKAGIGESFLLISPGGEIGPSSRAYHAGHVDDHPAPGTAEENDDIIAIGNAKIEATGDGLKITAGGVTYAFTAAGFAQTGGYQKHDGVNVGKDHKHTGVVPGGAITGNPQS